MKEEKLESETFKFESTFPFAMPFSQFPFNSIPHIYP